MTILRKLTLKISATVVRFASRGCKDWAEGIAHEATFIQDDWTALRWALGSTRILLHPREAPLVTLADVSAAAHKFVEARLNKIDARWLFPFFVAADYLLRFFTDARNLPQHIGCGMVVLASLVMGTDSFFQTRRINKLLRIDLEDEIVFYKKELRRSLALFPKGLVLISSFIVWMVGMMLSERGSFFADPVMNTFLAFLCVAIVPLMLHTRRLNQRRLAQLEALLPDV